MSDRERYERGYYAALLDSLRGRLKDQRTLPLDELYRRGYAEAVRSIEHGPDISQRVRELFRKEFNEEYYDSLDAPEETPEKQIHELRKYRAGLEDEPFKLAYADALIEGLQKEIEAKEIPDERKMSEMIALAAGDTGRKGRIYIKDPRTPHQAMTLRVRFGLGALASPDSKDLGPVKVSLAGSNTDPVLFVSAERILETDEKKNTADRLFNVISGICTRLGLRGVEVPVQPGSPFGKHLQPLFVKGAYERLRDHDMTLFVLERERERERGFNVLNLAAGRRPDDTGRGYTR